jgi:hypothetical protein
MQLVRPEQAEEDLPRMPCQSEGHAGSELFGKIQEPLPQKQH